MEVAPRPTVTTHARELAGAVGNRVRCRDAVPSAAIKSVAAPYEDSIHGITHTPGRCQRHLIAILGIWCRHSRYALCPGCRPVNDVGIRPDKPAGADRVPKVVGRRIFPVGPAYPHPRPQLCVVTFHRQRRVIRCFRVFVTATGQQRRILLALVATDTAVRWNSDCWPGNPVTGWRFTPGIRPFQREDVSQIFGCHRGRV